MTRPIYEPSEYRDLSKLGWRNRQLARRPAAASGVDVIEWAWMERTDDETVTDSTTIFVFDSANTLYQESDPSVIEVYDDGGDLYFMFNDFGIYVVWYGAVFSNNFDGEIQASIVANDGAAFLSDETAVESMETQTRGHTQRRATCTGTWIYSNLVGSGSIAGVSPKLSNFSGGSRDLTARAAVCYRVIPLVIS